MKVGTYFNNPDSSQRGAEAVRRAYAGRPKAVYPSHCPKCNRPVRPPETLVKDWPGTVRAADVTGLCQTCKYKSGKVRIRDKKGSEELQEWRLERARQEYDAMVADRRRRGIAPEGVQMPGEKPGSLSQAEISGRATIERKPSVQVEVTCSRGHGMVWVPSARRRRCYECERIRSLERRGRQLVAA